MGLAYSWGYKIGSYQFSWYLELYRIIKEVQVGKPSDPRNEAWSILMSKMDQEEATSEAGGKPTECGILEPNEGNVSVSREIKGVQYFWYKICWKFKIPISKETLSFFPHRNFSWHRKCWQPDEDTCPYLPVESEAVIFQLGSTPPSDISNTT